MPSQEQTLPLHFRLKLEFLLVIDAELCKRTVFCWLHSSLYLLLQHYELPWCWKADSEEATDD